MGFCDRCYAIVQCDWGLVINGGLWSSFVIWPSCMLLLCHTSSLTCPIITLKQLRMMLFLNLALLCDLLPYCGAFKAFQQKRLFKPKIIVKSGQMRFLMLGISPKNLFEYDSLLSKQIPKVQHQRFTYPIYCSSTQPEDIHM